ncbi:hypothetical protein GCM10010972_19980 [Cellulomonas carbonis]|uniref:DUF559 domain-containing protein n=1 Tax=Cellulomonas carbonis T26 TaxID=947969 RepID=A0A0A0BSZ6_9CELL|nr:hypothetical protein N868_05420 [Cellulomonas carbonis T26]GGC06731.1 hypothetical protein GCM10010972_19980 [Cellulomonas carbonis]
MLLARDHPDDDARRRLRDGEWRRLRPGAYVVADTLPTDPFELGTQLALAHAVAVSRQHRPGVLSHTTAALMWGLPLPGDPGPTHVIRPTTVSGSHADDVVRHLVRLAPDEVTTVAGMPVTTLARTAVDCAATLPAGHGLVVVDAARRSGVTAEALQRALAGRPGTRGIRRARAVVEHADDGAESPGESSTRAALIGLGLPRPETQVLVRTAAGDMWADLGWRGWRLLVEYDGRSKYEDGGVDALLKEKRRQDLVESAGWRVLRVTAADLRDRRLLVRRLRAVLPADVAATLRPVGPFAR